MSIIKSRNAEEIKQKIIEEVTNSPQKTLYLSQLQKAYQSILLQDLDYALDKKIEQDLWNFGFKNYIEFLQSGAKDKKNPKRIENQTLLSWFLQSATGFYINLLHQICKLFELDLPFRFQTLHSHDEINVPVNIRSPQLTSCWYICQHCLVHLGDLARYSRQLQHADSFYRQALNVSPRNGQPYNQLGLLRAAHGDRLGAAYYHARGLAVGGPFPPAANNFNRTLAAVSETNKRDKSDAKTPIEVPRLDFETRLNSKTYINNYIAVHHQLHTTVNLDELKQCVADLNSALIALVATDEFDSDTLIKMCCIDMYSYYSITESDKINYDDLTEDEKKVFSLTVELIAGSLTALLLPVHTRALEDTIKYPALPAVKILLEWIRLHPSILQNPAFVSRPQIWPGFSMLLVKLQGSIKNFSGDKYNVVPLPEDLELQGFIPIDAAFSELQFMHGRSLTRVDESDLSNCTNEEINAKMEETLQKSFLERKKSWQTPPDENDKVTMDSEFFNCLRAFRLILIGKWISNHQKESGTEYFSVTNDSGSGFEISSTVENPDVLKTIEELSLLREKRLNENIQLNAQDVASQESGDVSDTEMKETLKESFPIDKNTSPIAITEADIKEKVLEKRAGILKPQGSLEKAREKTLLKSSRIEVISPEPLKLSNELSVDNDIQDTGSSSSTVSQDGAMCTDINSLLDPSIFVDGSLEKKNVKKTRTNVAMQTIMKKQEDSVKQVKFLSPATTPDSISEQFTIPPEDDTTERKIIQPKVIKSLNAIPMNRKTGGILSLKDKSGYPHLVNVAPVSTAKSESDQMDSKLDKLSTNIKKSLDEMDDNVPGTDQNLPKDSPKLDNHPSFIPDKFDSGKNFYNQPNYPSWSNPNSFGRYPQVDRPGNPDWKFDPSNVPMDNKPGMYSYFHKKPDYSNISLPVVNPKEIDVRSMQRQKNEAQPHGYYPNKPYEAENFNNWQNYPNMHNMPMHKDSNMNKVNNMPPRFANAFRNPPPEFPERMPNPNYGFNQSPNKPYPPPGNPAFHGQNYWRPPDNVNFPNDYNLKEEVLFMPQNSKMFNTSQFEPNPMNVYQHNLFGNPMQNQNLQPSYNQFGPIPDFPVKNEPYFDTSKPPMPLNNPIGSEMSADYKFNQYQRPTTFKRESFDADPNKMHRFNAEIPEFVPRQRPEEGAAMKSNIYSLFDGPESPWKNDANAEQKSFWPEISQSPLEKLLEQQKQFK